MIIIKVEKQDNIVKKIDILGHALYDDYGKDIVCSAVSSITITSVNAIVRFNEKAIEHNVLEDGMHLIINSNDDITNTLLDNMLSLLKELARDYPKNIKFE